MQITRRNALLGASAAVAVAGVGKPALAGDLVVGLAQQLNAARTAWDSAIDAYEEAAHRVGFNICYDIGLVSVETSDGSCSWSAEEIQAAAEDGRQYHKLTPEQRDAALAEIERRQRKGHEVRRELGIETLHEEVEHWTARFWDLHARLLDTSASTPGGVLAKLRGFYHDGEIAQIMAGDDPDSDLPAEWAASIYRDLERLTGEVRS